MKTVTVQSAELLPKTVTMEDNMDVLKKVPVREQDAKVRATNFEEVCLGYNKEEAMEEAARCINCKNAQCIKGCPVSINIPGFIEKVKEGDIEAAYQVISEASALPAVCGRVCPQESQCEGKCIRGFKGDPISIGKLERFVAGRTVNVIRMNNQHDLRRVFDSAAAFYKKTESNKKETKL